MPTIYDKIILFLANIKFYYNLPTFTKIFVYKYKNHFNEMKGDVGMATSQKIKVTRNSCEGP